MESLDREPAPVCISCKTRHRRGENPGCLITQGRAPECACYLPPGEHYSGCMKRRWDEMPATLLGSRQP